VRQHFSNAYGQAAPFAYPTNHAEAAAWLDEFLAARLQHFGAYEDAMVMQEPLLYHSLLTPMLNIGLLNPQQVVDKTLAFAAVHALPLNSLEGFIRQIVGWREFIHQVYLRAGRQQRSTNYWGFTRQIPPQFWTGATGILPIDTVVKKALATGYNHHIERLMVLGNFFLLCEFDPNAVYHWFMEMYVDAYDWVMVPNVYGMTQFADGGLMTTKPYISGSNYLLKMSDVAKGPWTAVWDGLFWRFMHVHRNYFTQNPRLGMLVGTFDKMPAEKRAAHLAVAHQFLHQLDQWQLQ
jgi:deoxyribodipyrimidine photolyase-related protein